MSTGRHANVSIISYISLENKGGFMGCDQQHSEYPKYQLSQIDKSSMSAMSGGGEYMPTCRHADNDSFVNLIFLNKKMG